MDKPKKCPKCKAYMDKSNTKMAFGIARNDGTEFEPKYVLTGTAGALVFPHRCPACGFVELYVAGSISHSTDQSTN
jgi:hypothetical protein